MANMHLVTGFAGREHVTAADQAAFHNLFIGGGEFVLGTGNQFAASIISNNQVRVLDGDIYMQGRFIRLDKETYIDLAIDNGASGYFRNDLIVARYTQNHATAIEEVNLVVIKGEAVMENPEDPAYTTGDILVAGDMRNDMPLYRVVIDGLNLVELVPLFSVYEMNIQKLDREKQQKTELLEEKTSLLDVDHFPVFDASTQKHKKVLLSKIKDFLTNTFAGKMHEHKAGEITSGILPIARGGTGASSIDSLVSLLGAAIVEVGSYVGTGTSGSANPTSLTFDFAPKVLIMLENYFYTSGYISALNVTSLTTSFVEDRFGYRQAINTGYCKKSADGKTISWYSNYSSKYDAGYQYNQSGTTYAYIAIG